MSTVDGKVWDMSGIVWVVGCIVSMLALTATLSLIHRRKLRIDELLSCTCIAVAWPITSFLVIILGVGLLVNTAWMRYSE